MTGEVSSAGPLVFKALAAGREAVMLGAVQVGEIMPITEPIKHSHCFRVTLPDSAATRWRPAGSLDAARRGIHRFIGDWLNAADLRPNVDADREGAS